MNQTKLIALIIILAAGVSAAVYIGLDEAKSYIVEKRLETYQEKLERLNQIPIDMKLTIDNALRNGPPSLTGCTQQVLQDYYNCAVKLLPHEDSVILVRKITTLSNEYERLTNDLEKMESGDDVGFEFKPPILG